MTPLFRIPLPTDPRTPEETVTAMKQVLTSLRVFERDLNKTFLASRGTCLGHFAKASLPSAIDNRNNSVIVTDDVTGIILAYSDGTQWLRTTDGSPVI